MPFKWAALVGPGDVGIQVHRPRIHLSAAIPDGGKCPVVTRNVAWRPSSPWSSFMPGEDVSRQVFGARVDGTLRRKVRHADLLVT